MGKPIKIVVKKAKPTSAGRRHVVSVKVEGLHKGPAVKSLLAAKPKNGGRNNHGRTTVWSRGGGHKQKYRIIDFRRNDKDGIPAKVERLEYDPNRTAYIALLLYRDGERRYMVAPKGLNAGDEILNGSDAPIKTGNCLPLINIPVGSIVHCIEMMPGNGAKIARSAGTSAQILGRDGKYVTLRLKSGEVRKVLAICRAVIGEVCKSEHNLRKLGKAGANRWRGKKPSVRAVAMNPVDHPMGGGEGRTSGGRPPCTPWGVPTKGYKTRNKKKASNKYIVSKRTTKKGGKK